MQIISTRRQFVADHSSTSYFFYAAKPLTQKAQAYVNTLSSHVDVGSRTAEITYHGEFADLGDVRRKKFLEYYDVEVRESYDWWTLSLVLEAARLPKINFADYEAEEEASLTFAKQGKRIILCFDGWHQDYSSAYGEFGENAMEELAELGLKLRQELYAGKTDALRVMHHYCVENSVVQGKTAAAKKLAAILEPI